MKIYQKYPARLEIVEPKCLVVDENNSQTGWVFSEDFEESESDDSDTFELLNILSTKTLH